MDELDDIKHIFFEECDELLIELERELHNLRDGASQAGAGAETINAIFRAVHSIKGGAGAFGLEALVRFAHRVESVLDDLRAGRFVANPATCDLLFQASDRLSGLVDQAKSGASLSDGSETAIAEALEAHARGEGPVDPVPVAASFATPPPVVEDDPFDPFAGLTFSPVQVALDPIPTRHVLTLRPLASLYACGDDIRTALTTLAAFGPCDTTVNCDYLPSLDALVAHQPCLAWHVVLHATVTQEDIRAALEWSLNDLGLSFETPCRDTAPRVPDMPPMQPAEAASTPSDEKSQALPLNDVEKPRDASASDAPVAGGTKGQTSIRVDLARVDKLVDLVGELVINQAALQQWLSQLPKQQAASAASALSSLDHLTRELQEGVMAMRAHPIGTVFQRMGRVVREAAAATKKPVRLVLSGEEIEVDRSIVEHLVEPLTHILRNAVDHGIESREGRTAAHKPPEGEIRLTARHRADRLVVEISDDGRGIDPERVRAKAVERGLIDENALLDTNQIQNLIFAPGFSTAATVSDLSGRGVGMDVVKRTVAELGGRISVQSEPGRGTDIVLSLPLTLAVLDGMIFRAGGQTFIAPVGHVVESLTPDAHKVFSLSDGSLIFSARGLHLPIVDVGAALTQQPCVQDGRVPLVMIVESESGHRMALAVDDIVQQAQIVIKSIEKNYARIPGIAAATILGNGDVALIIDIDALTDRQETLGHHRASPPPCPQHDGYE